MQMVSLKIDGIQVEVPKDSTILDAARQAGVHIPVLCHDSRLNPFGACRVCLIEAVGNPRMMTACTTPVAPDMDILTNTEKLQRIRKTIIELLLVNHPLECPVCDKGGECTLQDLTYETGLTKVRFDAHPADTLVDHTNPFIERDVDRCVLCGRCVRICDEVVNIQAISFINRGMETMIGTAFDQPWNCEFCGQCISVCPVGSLNNRVYLFKNRAWNLERTESICGLCGCGCYIELEAEHGELYRMGELPEKGANHGNLCAKGRFGFEFVNSVKRETSAKVKENGEFAAASFEQAVEIIAEKIKSVKAQYGAGAVGVLVSPRLTNEEAFLAQKFAREVVGTPNIYSLEPVTSLPEGTYSDVEHSDAVVVINIDITEANPILGLAVRAAARKNEASLNVFYPSETALKRLAEKHFTGTPEEVYASLSRLVKGEGAEGELLARLQKADKPVAVYSPYHKEDLRFVAELKAKVPALKLVAARAKANSQGVIDMGAKNGTAPGLLEAERGVLLKDGLENKSIKALIVLGENLALRTGWAGVDLGSAEFLAVTDPFMSATASKAGVYIPVATYAEKDGSFTNLEGRVQTVRKAVDKGLVTDGEVIAALSAKLGGKLPASPSEIRELIRKENPLYKDVDFEGGIVSYPYAIKGEFSETKAVSKGEGAYFLYPSSLRLHSGSYTRWSPDLAKVYGAAKLEISPADADALGVENGGFVSLSAAGVTTAFPVHIEKHITQGCVALPEDFAETSAIFSKGRYHKVSLAKKS